MFLPPNDWHSTHHRSDCGGQAFGSRWLSLSPKVHLRSSHSEVDTDSEGGQPHTGSVLLQPVSRDLMIHKVQHLQTLVCKPQGHLCKHGYSIVLRTAFSSKRQAVVSFNFAPEISPPYQDSNDAIFAPQNAETIWPRYCVVDMSAPACVRVCLLLCLQPFPCAPVCAHVCTTQPRAPKRSCCLRKCLMGTPKTPYSVQKTAYMMRTCETKQKHTITTEVGKENSLPNFMHSCIHVVVCWSVGWEFSVFIHFIHLKSTPIQTICKAIVHCWFPLKPRTF